MGNTNEHKNCDQNNHLATDSQNKNNTSGVSNNDFLIKAPFTPDFISELGKKEIFVFGSNLVGHHAGGAARTAHNKFGAIWGQGEGLQGNSYAIPTMQGGVETIKLYVDRFIECAKDKPDLIFYVTKIGCGIAGFNEEDIAPLFINATSVPNIRLPKSFIDIINSLQEISSNRLNSDNTKSEPDAHILIKKTSKYNGLLIDEDIVRREHGITRTMVDLIIARNKEEKFTDPSDVLSFAEQIYRGHGRVESLPILFDILYSENFFEDGKLDTDKLYDLFLTKGVVEDELYKLYELYDREKVFNIISYLNTVRRYKNRAQILNDLKKIKVNFWGGNPYPLEQLITPEGSGLRYPLHYFTYFIKDNWDKIAPEGVLSSEILEEMIFNRHERRLRQLGLKEVLKQDYEVYSCWSSYHPKEVGTGPVYIDKADGKYAISCGEGAGPNNIPHFLEYMIAVQLLEEDPNYVKRGAYFIPQTNVDLPLIKNLNFEGLEVVYFESNESKIKFIEDLMHSK